MRALPALLTVFLVGCGSLTGQLTSYPDLQGPSSPLNNIAAKGYTNAAGKFAVLYPEEWEVLQNETITVGGKPARGASLSPPASMLQNTPVLSAKIHLAKMDGPCPAAGGQTVELGGKTYGQISRSNAQEESLEQAKSYLYENAGSCYAITMLTVTCRGTGCTSSQTFDRKQLTDAFKLAAISLTLL